VGNKRRRPAHDASHDRKRVCSDLFWRILLVTHGGMLTNSRAACRKPLGRLGEALESVTTMSAAFFSGVVPEMLAGGDEDERGLDILGPMSTGSSVVQSKRVQFICPQRLTALLALLIARILPRFQHLVLHSARAHPSYSFPCLLFEPYLTHS
jgi:hypothetical protein